MDVTSLNLTYPGILDHFGKHKVSGRTDSRAFLGWFLENYFRLEQLRVEDSICDGPDDKGVDGIYVDSTLEVIYVFQAKLMQKDSRTLGDSGLREFAGTLRQFDSPESLKALADSTGMWSSRTSSLTRIWQPGSRPDTRSEGSFSRMRSWTATASCSSLRKPDHGL